MKKLLTILTCLLLSGCGTVFNLSRPAELKPNPDDQGYNWGETPTMEYYGGVKINLGLFTPFMLVDLPLSAVADTLTLPIVYFSLPNEEKTKQNNKNMEDKNVAIKNTEKNNIINNTDK